MALADPDGRPEAAAEHAELLAALRAAVAEVLTPQQREVLLTVVAGRVPLDVLAERRGTTRAAPSTRRSTTRGAAAPGRGRAAGGEGGEPEMSLVDGLLGPEEPGVGCDDCFAELDLRGAGAGRRPAPTPPPRAPRPPGRLPGLPGGARQPPRPAHRRGRLSPR